MPLLEVTDRGIYCAKGDFFIDPWKPVDKALITHAHADHARWGSSKYLAHHDSLPVLRLRLGKDIRVQGIEYNKVLTINGVKVSFHPAGHILGSAQIKVSNSSETWVVSGDYKLENDGISTPFEPVKCTHFITESTFGLPVYQWEEQAIIFADLNNWWQQNQQAGKTSVLFAYALGKAQRLINGLNPYLGKVYVHGAVWNIIEACKALYHFNIEVIPITKETPKQDLQKQMIVAPPSAMGSTWMRKFQPYNTAIASGWMAVRGQKRRRAVDKGFIMSDHADWNGLLAAIKATEAQNIYVTHGYSHIFSRYLNESGYNAQVLETLFEGENIDQQGV